MTPTFKDHFSTQSPQYRRYRPHYPAELFAWLSHLCPHHTLAWDCATGSGQAARALAQYFHQVVATDASEQQIAQCPPHAGVTYQVAQAELAPFADASIDLITVAQALHWFDLERFYPEAWRVLRAAGVIAVWNYNLLSISPQIDAVVQYYYQDVVGPYWPNERRLVEQGYAPLPSLFHEIQAPEFQMHAQWTLGDLIGYLGTWSASKYYFEAEQQDPLQKIQMELEQAWGNTDQSCVVHWPLQLRVGSKPSNP